MKRVAVYCGSRVPQDQEIVELAQNLGAFWLRKTSLLYMEVEKLGLWESLQMPACNIKEK